MAAVKKQGAMVRQMRYLFTLPHQLTASYCPSVSLDSMKVNMGETYIKNQLKSKMFWCIMPRPA